MLIVSIMNCLFVFSIGILIGVLFAFTIFQRQLSKEIHAYQVIEYLKQDYKRYYNWERCKK